MKTGNFEENNDEIDNAIGNFSNFELCPFCQFVFKKDGLLQHKNHCKIKLKTKLDSMLTAETPDQIYESNKKIFAPIATSHPKPLDMLRQCLNENVYVKAYFEVQYLEEKFNFNFNLILFLI